MTDVEMVLQGQVDMDLVINCEVHTYHIEPNLSAPRQFEEILVRNCDLTRVDVLAQEIRKLIISAILATDMSFHFSLTTEFKNHAGQSAASILLTLPRSSMLPVLGSDYLLVAGGCDCSHPPAMLINAVL